MSPLRHNTPPRVLPIQTPRQFDDAVEIAAAHLIAGEVVAIPTETVYGLAANALNPQAVSKIYSLKGRPSKNPIIVHVASREMIEDCTAAWPESARILAEAFWPGPLTLVLPRKQTVPDIVTAGGSTVGIRWPGHPFMQAVIRRCGFPLAAPSANLANQVSPTCAEHVLTGFGSAIPLIVDGGQCQVGIESTVVDVSVNPVRVLRPGMIHAGQIASLVPVQTEALNNADTVLKSPGQLVRHYSPKAELRMLHWRDGDDLRRQLEVQGLQGKKVQIVTHSNIPSGFDNESVSVIPHDAEAFARALYSELHQCDAKKVDVIVIETLPGTPEWQGIADRLQRAAAKG